jgi:hypothetical protein
MIVAWRSGSEQGVCKMGNIALGGIFLNTPKPRSVGTVLDLIFEVAAGTHVRARAVVPGDESESMASNRFPRSLQLENRSPQQTQ